VFEFDYRLVGTGWAKAHIADDNGEVFVTASYLSDALGGLIDAVASVLEGAPEARTSWDEEPGEYRWILTRAADDVDVRVLAFPELWGSRPDEEGEELFRSRQSAVGLASAVLSAAQRVLDEHGEDGYQQQWLEHPFPTATFDRLHRAVVAAS
jgi:hypothetical protein